MTDMHREDFERGIRLEYKNFDSIEAFELDEDGDYYDEALIDMWRGWQAALRYRDELLAILDASQGYVCVKADNPSALAYFTEYFVRNYPGPNTIISDPNWHAPRIFRAARHCLLAASKETNRE